MLFNVPVEPERALNPPQLSKRMTHLRDRYLGQDPRRSRTTRGVTACTRKSVTHPPLNNAPLCEPARLVGPPLTRQWPARLYARAPSRRLRLDHSGFAPTHVMVESLLL